VLGRSNVIRASHDDHHLASRSEGQIRAKAYGTRTAISGGSLKVRSHPCRKRGQW
jgi:hypothetical protein